MDSYDKLNLLSQQMEVEIDSTDEVSCLSPIAEDRINISHALLPNGKKLRLLKTVLSSACENNCYYCAFRAGRDFHRITIKPEELAHTFFSLYNAGVVDGIFISSGIIKGGVFTQDHLIDVADILRTKLNFRGYIHLKIMPGSEYDQVFRSMQLANRVSINLEAPNNQRLAMIAPCKTNFESLLLPIRWIDQIRQSQDPHQGWNHRWPSSSTQFVVGAADETDLELLSTTEFLYHQLHLKRSYFSKFKPIPDTPLSDKIGESATRELRLYQASYLLRDYGFSLEDLPLDKNGNLPQQTDPKFSWAMYHLNTKPVEINQADIKELLQIPGIGPKTAQLIISKRRIHKFLDIDQLVGLGVNRQKIAPFILINGKKPPVQQSFIFFDS